MVEIRMFPHVAQYCARVLTVLAQLFLGFALFSSPVFSQTLWVSPGRVFLGPFAVKGRLQTKEKAGLLMVVAWGPCGIGARRSWLWKAECGEYTSCETELLGEWTDYEKLNRNFREF